MLKELVRERLLAAADEIFQLFEGTIATYKEQVCRAREESERHRRKLQAVCKTQIDRRVDDVQQLKSQQDKSPPHQQGDYASSKPHRVAKEDNDTQKSHIQDDAEDPRHSYFTEDDAQPLIIKEEEGEKFPLLSVCVKSENNANEPSEWLQLLQNSPGEDHCGRAPPDDLVPPISDSYDTDTGHDETTPPFQMVNRCHPHKKGFSCSICGKILAYKGNLIGHMRTHNEEKPFSCSICGQTFSQRKSVKLHMRRHTGEKPFTCSTCGKTFSRKESLKAHMRTHTGEKPFSCSICGHTFSQKENMLKHVRKHTGEKPFSCLNCGKTFSRKETLKLHMRTHTGENPFNCSICGKTFSRKDHVKSHMRTHTQEKSFCCFICGVEFSQNHNLITHMRTHTGE
ncbi:uncharacterized protein LOC144215927 [Stigmatopora nigra]